MPIIFEFLHTKHRTDVTRISSITIQLLDSPISTVDVPLTLIDPDDPDPDPDAGDDDLGVGVVLLVSELDDDGAAMRKCKIITHLDQ